MLLTMRLPGDLWFNQMLLLAWLAEEDDEDDNERFYNQFNGEGRRCRDRPLLRPTLLLPSMETTPWMKLYAARHDPALITCNSTLSQSYWHYLGRITTILLPGHWMGGSTQKVTLVEMK
jgi:hypothetical protein